MKKAILLAAVCVASAIGLKAQTTTTNTAAPQGKHMHEHTKKSPDERAAMDADRATQKLGLSADQKTQWQNAALTRIKANDPLREQMRTNPSQKQQFADQMRANNKTFDTTVNGFLTADQKTKWEQAKQERKGGHKKMSGPSMQSNDMAPEQEN